MSLYFDCPVITCSLLNPPHQKLNQMSFSTCSTNFNFHQAIPPFPHRDSHPPLSAPWPPRSPTFSQLRQAPAARLHWIHLLGGGGYLVQPHPRVEGEPPGVLDAHRWPGDEDGWYGWWGGRGKGKVGVLEMIGGGGGGGGDDDDDDDDEDDVSV